MEQSIKYTLNMDRIKHLIQFYKITQEDFLSIANTGIKQEKNRLKFSDFSEEVKLSIIKKIDKEFGKGLTWYIDSKPPLQTSQSSIFYRKEKFNSNLRLEDIKVIHDFDKKRILTQILCKNINYVFKRKIQKFTTHDSINKAVDQVNNTLTKPTSINWKNTKENGQDKNYLNYLCKELEHYGIFIFEYLEHHNKKELVNFDGFYLENIIVIKQHRNVRQEIFTLMHEFAHFLLEKEEIDEVTDIPHLQELLEIEKWCNNFAFNFLIGEQKKLFKMLKPNKSNRYNEHEIQDIVNKTFLNPQACYLNLLYEKKITQTIYHAKKDEIDARYTQQVAKEKAEREQKKATSEKKLDHSPKAIQSSIFEDIVKRNFNDGAIDDVDYCNYLGLSKKERDELFKELYQ